MKHKCKSLQLYIIWRYHFFNCQKGRYPRVQVFTQRLHIPDHAAVKFSLKKQISQRQSRRVTISDGTCSFVETGSFNQCSCLQCPPNCTMKQSEQWPVMRMKPFFCTCVMFKRSSEHVVCIVDSRISEMFQGKEVES